MIRLRPALLPVSAFLLWLAACGPNRESQPANFERMRMQQRPGPYQSSRFFDNQMVMRTPPQGSVARRSNALDSLPALTAQQVPEATRLFHVYCAVCHGRDGNGGSVVGANMREHAPPPLTTVSAQSLSDQQLLEIIEHGKGNMGPYGWALTPAERGLVGAYIRTLPGRSQ